MARIVNRIAAGYEYSAQQLARLDVYANKEGLTSQQMTVLMSEIDNRYVDLEIKLKLIKCLIPRDKICEEIFITATWILICCTTNVKLKIEVLKWMIAAYPFMAVSSGRFAFLYETFLTLLPYQELRSFLCHLLYVTTTKQSVTRRRIALVSKSLMNFGKYPRLIRILQLYYELCPEYFDGKFAAIDFEFTNESLGVYFTRMQSRVQLNAVNTQFYLKFKSMRLCSMDFEEIESDEEETDEFLQIKSFNQFYQVLNSLEKKRDIKAILETDAFYFLFTTNISENNRIIIQDYILTYLYRNAGSSLHLNIILKIFQSLQSGLPHVSDVVKKLQPKIWNLKSDLITKLIQYEPLCCFERILPNLAVVREYMQQFGFSVQSKLIKLLSNLYVNWILMACEDEEFFCDCKSFFLDESLKQRHSEIDAINKLGCYIDGVCKELVSRNDHPSLLNEVLLHYVRISFTHQNMEAGMSIRFLPFEIFIHAVFSSSVCTLNSLCHLMLCYNKEIEHMFAVNHPECKNAKKHYIFYVGELTKLLCDMSHVKGGKYSLQEHLSVKSKLDVPNLEMTVLYKLPSLLWHTKTFPYRKLLTNFTKKKELRRKFYKHIGKDGFNSLRKFFSDLEKILENM